MRRTCFGSWATSMPTTRSVPAVGRVSVAIVRMSVVLPAPFGPRTASTLPGRDREVQPGERLDVAEVLREALGLDHQIHASGSIVNCRSRLRTAWVGRRE